MFYQQNAGLHNFVYITFVRSNEFFHKLRLLLLLRFFCAIVIIVILCKSVNGVVLLEI